MSFLFGALFIFLFLGELGGEILSGEKRVVRL